MEVRNYKVIRKAALKELADLNIVIGPNNCGKTSLLEVISKLSEMTYGGAYNYLCSDCNKVATNHEEFVGFSIPLGDRERFAGKREPRIAFELNKQEIDRLIPTIIPKLERILTNPSASFSPCKTARLNLEKLVFAVSGIRFVGEHVSLFAHVDILEWLKNTVLTIPEQRLDSYKKVDIRSYIAEKNLPGSKLRKWLNLTKQLVDQNIRDYTYTLNLTRDFGELQFESMFEEEGSGLRAVACSIADIIDREDANVITLDEPELGLNPASKHKLLEFLLQESGKRQIFIATHDPTFVNPSLWIGYRVSVYLYSAYKQGYVRVNLKESKQAPATFAGYLPQTVSLKDIHVYVEGESDVYIFQVFLRKYLKQHRKDWSLVLNRIGIYHLAGSFWPHLLSTTPQCPPYKVLVILDGDKKEEVAKIFKANNDFPRMNLKFCKTLKEIEQSFGTSKLIYCLEKENIEKYLQSNKNRIVNKKIDGPAIAEDMRNLPRELEGLFKILVKCGVNITKYVSVSDTLHGHDNFKR